MECPTDQALLDYFGTDTRPEALEHHVDGCTRCREVLSALAAGETNLEDTLTQPGGEPGLGDVLARGVLDDKYRLEGVLGAGGMGVVMLATHLLLNQKVAIKFLRPSLAAVPGSEERFLDEARLAAKLKSVHVVRVSDVSMSRDGRPYMVMEYLDGEDLEHRLLRGLPSVPDVMRLTAQIIDALAEAHAMSLIHRDLKPANLFLTRGRDRETVLKVLDFGLARSIDATGPRTKSGILAGSPLYMAPEQFRHEKSLDTRVDLWGLGCVMYRMLSGRVPFLADSLGEVVARIQRDDPTPLEVLRPTLPKPLTAVVTQLLDKQPDRRPRNIAEVAFRLRELMPAEVRPLIDRAAAGTARGGGAVTPTSVRKTTARPRPAMLPLMFGITAGATGLAAIAFVLISELNRKEPLVVPAPQVQQPAQVPVAAEPPEPAVAEPEQPPEPAPDFEPAGAPAERTRVKRRSASRPHVDGGPTSVFDTRE